MEERMQIWEMATCVEKAKWALIVFLSPEGKASEAVLELDIAVLNSEDGMVKTYEKLDTLFRRYKPVHFYNLQKDIGDNLTHQ